METLIVTLGLARPDHTWFEAIVNLEVNNDNFDPEENIPDEDSDETLAQIAFAQWCSDQVPGGLEKGFDRAEAASKVSIPIAGHFVLHWEWAERPDRPCDRNCLRVVGNNDSLECTCSRSRTSG